MVAFRTLLILCTTLDTGQREYSIIERCSEGVQVQNSQMNESCTQLQSIGLGRTLLVPVTAVTCEYDNEY